MTAYSVIYTRTDSHNFITETQVKGIFLDYDDASNCFKSIKLQIKQNDPNYEIAKKEYNEKDSEVFDEFAFWVDSTSINEMNGVCSDYYEVTLRIIRSNIVNKKGEQQ